ncbi:metallophosphoesterase, partial [Streptomyces sp. TR02-1]
RVVAWPGYLWLALLLYLTLALLVGEGVRPVLRWVLARRAGRPVGRVVEAAGAGAVRVPVGGAPPTREGARDDGAGGGRE